DWDAREGASCSLPFESFRFVPARFVHPGTPRKRSAFLMSTNRTPLLGGSLAVAVALLGCTGAIGDSQRIAERSGAARRGDLGTRRSATAGRDRRRRGVRRRL